jgi:tetratricopeptide (TPR) repeat protein
VEGNVVTLEEIFLAAVEKAPADRAAYLDTACGSDIDLRAQVEALLRSHDEAGSLLEQPLFRPGPTVGEPPAAEQPSVVLAGRFKLLEAIGEGGMGTVWKAQQTEPVKRLVAVKLIKAGLGFKAVLARFEAERQALALMDHPNIAKVLDAGAAPDGRPFFVMELVKGVPITRYCDEHRLTPKQRLELFVPVCQAVQHAHQKGIIHRDLKPSNVMVCLYDGQPVPKVIDFGVAKAAGPKLTEKTLFTEVGSVVGTLEYMSPEQAEVNQLDIDTRSDIYSLGVLLYELLTGTTPLERKRFKEAAFLEVLRLIREEESPRPSTRLSTAEGLASIAANRGLEPKKLSGLVRGELDWIVMKALDKDRNRRYETASAFAADVERYLHDEPVRACPPSALYWFGKFARRNRMALTAASAICVAVVVTVVVLAVNNAVIARQKQEKEQALEQKEEALKKARQEEMEKDKALKQKEKALDQARLEKERADQNLDKADEAVEHYLFRIAEDPRLKSADLHALRKALLGNAIPYYEAFIQQQQKDAKLQAKQGMAYYALAYLRTEMGEREQAMADYERAEAIFAHLAADLPARPRHRQLLGYCHNALGNELKGLGKLTEAEAAYGKALTVQERLVGEFPDSPYYRLELAGTHSNLGLLFNKRGDPVQAQAHLALALALRKKLAEEFPKLPQCRQDLARSHVHLGQLLLALDKRDDTAAHYRQALDLQEELTREFPGISDYRDDLAGTHLNLGGLMSALGKPAEAERHYRLAIDFQKKLTDDFPDVPEYRRRLAMGLNNLGIALHALWRPEEAEVAYRQALALRKKLAEESPGVHAYRGELAGTYNGLGLLLRAQHKSTDAHESFRQALALQEKLTAEVPSPQYESALGATLKNLAMMLMDRGELAEAERLLRQAIAHQKAALRPFPRHPHYRQLLCSSYGHLARTLLEKGEHAEAARLAEELVQVSPGTPADSFNAACYLAKCVALAEEDPMMAAEKRKELAQSYADRAVKLLRAAFEIGWTDAELVSQIPWLDPLRQRADFKRLLADLQKNTKK